MAKAYSRPPSSFVGMQPGSLRAFYLDRGIKRWAGRIEAEMSVAESKAKNPKFAQGMRQRILENHLSKGESPSEKAKRYRDPAVPKPKEKKADEDVVLGGDDGRLRPGDRSR